jgi:hypothetical protein
MCILISPAFCFEQQHAAALNSSNQNDQLLCTIGGTVLSANGEPLKKAHVVLNQMG